MVDKAGLYGGGLELTCILYEGELTSTAGTSVFVENGALGKLSHSFAATVSEGDLVSVHNNAANDYDACNGIPVVQGTLSTTTGWDGIVKSQPVWHKIPTSAGAHAGGSDTTWAATLSNGWYRVATVVFPGVSMAIRGVIDGTDIVAGCPVGWDLSESAWGDAGTTLTGCFSFHDGSTDAQNALIGFGATGTVAASTGICGFQVQ